TRCLCLTLLKSVSFHTLTPQLWLSPVGCGYAVAGGFRPISGKRLPRPMYSRAHCQEDLPQCAPALLLLRQPQPPLTDGSAMRVPHETNLRRAIRLGSPCPSRIDRQEAPFAAAFHDLS